MRCARGCLHSRAEFSLWHDRAAKVPFMNLVGAGLRHLSESYCLLLESTTFLIYQ